MWRSGAMVLLIMTLFFFPFIQGCDEEVPEDISLGDDLYRTPEQAYELSNMERDVDLYISGDNDTSNLKFGMTQSSGFLPSDPLKPGEELYLKVRVYRDEPVYAGGFVEFSLGDEASLGWIDWVVDTVPFYIDANSKYVDVETYYRIPYSRFNHLAEGIQEKLFLTVAVLPDKTCNDTNLDNNLLHVPTNIEGIPFYAHDPVPQLTVDNLYCRKAAASPIRHATPGEYVSLYTDIRLSDPSKRAPYSYSTYVDHSLILPRKRAGGDVLSSLDLWVPWDLPQGKTSFYYQVIAENGHQLSYNLPIENYDLEMRDVGIYWEDFSNTSSGSTVKIKCKIFNNSEVPFSRFENFSRYLFVVNGEVSDPLKLDSSTTANINRYMGEVTYLYTIPENCQWPLEVYVLADPFSLMHEKSEYNNVARAEIPLPPVSAPGDSINLSVSPENLWHYPTEVRPGEKLYLFAAVYNDSTKPLGGFRVHFSINYYEIDENNSLFQGTIPPGQYRIFFKEWDVPEDITGSPIFEVKITHPNDNLYNADDDIDNRAEMNLTLSKPDLLVDEARITGLAGSPLRGQQLANVTVGVWNNGDAWANDAVVDIFLCGEKVGSKTVSVPPRGGLSFTIPVIVPLMAAQNPPVDTINALPGIVRPPDGYYNVDLLASADPDNLIDESDETNNELGPIYVEAARSQGQGVVYAHVYSLDDNQSLARAWVTINAGGQTLSTFTDEDGNCSFHYVPQGSFELTATAEGLNESTQTGTIYSGHTEDILFYLNDYSFIRGRVTDQSGNPIEGVCVELRDFVYDWSLHHQDQGVTQNSRAFTDATGNFTIYVPAGDHVLDVSKLGYEPQTIETSVTSASKSSHNLTMLQTNLAYLQVLVTDGLGNPLQVNLEALDSNKQPLNPRVTRLTSDRPVEYLGQAYVEMRIPISAPEVDNMYVRASGEGRDKTVSVQLAQGLENYITITFGQSASGSSDDHQSGIIKKIIPHKTETTQAGATGHSLYGLFNISALVRVSNSVMTQFSVTITPDYWHYNGVQDRWTPLGVEEIGMDIVCENHSSQRTIARIDKVAILSNGFEVGQVYYPGLIPLFTPPQGLPYFDWNCNPNVGINWDNVRIRLYIFVDGDTSSPLKNNEPNIIVEWDPKQNNLRLGNYQLDWDTNVYTESWQ